MLDFNKKNKYIFIVSFGIVFFLCTLVFIDATKQMRRAESATASYQKWANSPDGIAVRRLQREIDEQKRRESINCYLDNYGADYDAALDCSENPSLRLELAPPIAWVYPSLWHYSLPQRVFGDDIRKSIHKRNLVAIEYWESRGDNW